MNLHVSRYRVEPGTNIRLAHLDTGDTGPFGSKEESAGFLEKRLDRLFELQGLLYAERRYALLVILQGMDASGKDGVIGHVMRGLNPQGTSVVPFKVPSEEELAHDFLWRASRALPRRGEIAVFNRSHYEEVLVVRVHPEWLQRQRLPADRVTKRFWDERLEDIRTFEEHLVRSGTVIVKFFLHVSRKEQRERLLARVDDPAKNWKMNSADLVERERWNDYQRAYEQAVSATSTKGAPWYVVPADHKWFARALVGEVLIETLASLGLQWPKLDPTEAARLKRAAAALRKG